MQTTRELTLPQSSTFYQREFTYRVTIDPKACGTHTVVVKDKPYSFSVGVDPVLAGAIGACKKDLSTTIEAVAESAMRFFRTGGPRALQFAEFQNERFRLLWSFGQMLRHTAGGSLRHSYPKETYLHGESRRALMELFAYGLALDFMRQCFGLSPSRFFFIDNGVAQGIRTRDA